ncbi:hypothetical protein F4553_002260 [Allocatelliglobosispora scoriae]|uniref:Uncharacterized protein n=1 Tax=Allocatelliglobosispora scoriae TaxID=643052 RepID=A0A841BPX2_9ACTN|nr:hypothetical protein [Allocatelliglobosispora scoriae]
MIAPGQKPADGKRTRRLIGGIVAGVATLIGITSGVIGIAEFLDRGTPAFAQPIDTVEGMREFLSFADEHDGELVRLETRCVFHDGPMPCSQQGDPLQRASVLLDLNADPSCDPDRVQPCTGSVVLFFFAENVTDAQIDNGEYGAGSIVVRGYFTVSRRGSLGTLPEGTTAIYLTAVPADEVKDE